MATKSTTPKDRNSPKKLNPQPQKFVIHRTQTNMEPETPHSCLRTKPKKNKDAKADNDEENLTDPESPQQAINPVPKFNVRFQNTDIIFSNGNTREKRRAELFQNYTSYTKYQLENREDLFLQQENHLKEKLRLLNEPKNFHLHGTRAVPNYKEIDNALYEADGDLLERRDYELTRLKLTRQFDKNKVLAKYKTESFKIYKESAVAMDAHLEKLKQFFINQRTILMNLDKELVDIGSSRAERLYTGFEIKGTAATASNNSGSDTDSTSVSSGVDSKFIPSSIMEALTPITTEKEFQAVINDSLDTLNPNIKLLQHTRNGFANSTNMDPATNISDTDAGETSNQETAATPIPQYTATGRRRVGRPANVPRAVNTQANSVEPSSSTTTATTAANGEKNSGIGAGTVRMSRSDANNILNYNPEFAKQNPNYISNLINKHFHFPFDIVTEEMEQEISVLKKINDEEKERLGSDIQNRYYL
ncbi:hypothetical protein WICPIJ_008785 [Wickerhamomyces pijperi]|uniref:Uncharacterized protein n=1 Tax=Wickerhamomyces pijperi TaxID=599730 RepID=A0A9P8THU8_WICPI|nr:hypothetical protein WICPIJ_008785 [Wickerhamomyces pijperi]